MKTDLKHTLLFVDDEKSILKSLKRLFYKQNYEVLLASSGEEGLEIISKPEMKISLIISDQRMPGMGGAAFLEHARKLMPDTIRFLLTGYSDMSAVIDSVNKGEIHRYLTKPWNDEDLVLQVKNALKHYDLILENRKLLQLTKKQNRQLYTFGKNMELLVKKRTKETEEKSKALEFLNKELEYNLVNIVRAFANLADLSVPKIKGHGKRVSNLSCEMAKIMKLTSEDLFQIEIAAMLHDIGKTGFPENLQVVENIEKLSPMDRKKYKQHPGNSSNILAFINNLDKASLYARHHHERYDGSGFPDGLLEDEIPLGAKIIAVADYYDNITELQTDVSKIKKQYMSDRKLTQTIKDPENLLKQSALHQIKKCAFTAFDPEIIKILARVLENQGVELIQERSIKIEDLQESMITSRALFTVEGGFLLPENTVISSRILKNLKTYCSNKELDDTIFIHKNVEDNNDELR